MNRVIIVAACSLGLTGCLAGNMARNLSLKGKPLASLEQRYGQPDHKEPFTGGNRYTWKSADDQHPCTLLVTTDAAERATDVKMVGDNRDCYRFRNMAVGPH